MESEYELHLWIKKPLVEVKMPPKSTSTLTGTRRLVICDHCGKEYEQRNFKEHTKRVNPG